MVENEPHGYTSYYQYLHDFVVHSNKKPKPTLGGHFLVSTFHSAILFSVRQADKSLPPEQITRINKARFGTIKLSLP